jgi:hypothetical protein
LRASVVALLVTACATTPPPPPPVSVTINTPLTGARVLAMSAPESMRARFIQALAERGVQVDSTARALSLEWVVTLSDSCATPGNGAVVRVSSMKRAAPNDWALVVAREDGDCGALIRDAAEAIDRAFSPASADGGG